MQYSEKIKVLKLGKTAGKILFTRHALKTLLNCES